MCVLETKDAFFSTMHSIKTFWSPELKRERAVRKEEMQKAALLQEQLRMSQTEGQVRCEVFSCNFVHFIAESAVGNATNAAGLLVTIRPVQTQRGLRSARRGLRLCPHGTRSVCCSFFFTNSARDEHRFMHFCTAKRTSYA